MLNKLALTIIISVILFPVVSRAAGFAAAPAPAASSAPAAIAAKSGKALFDRAFGLYMQGSFAQASEEFLGYLKEFPEGERADRSLYWLGKCFEMAGHFDEAEIMLRRAINGFPASDIAASIQFELGYCLYSPQNPGRDLAKALAELMKVPSLYQRDPLVAQALYYAAKCRIELKEPALAKEILMRITEKFPDSPYAAPALYNLGRIALAEGDAGAAESSFNALLARYPAGLYSGEAAAASKLAEGAGAEKSLTAVTLK